MVSLSLLIQIFFFTKESRKNEKKEISSTLALSSKTKNIYFYKFSISTTLIHRWCRRRLCRFAVVRFSSSKVLVGVNITLIFIGWILIIASCLCIYGTFKRQSRMLIPFMFALLQAVSLVILLEFLPEFIDDLGAGWFILINFTIGESLICWHLASFSHETYSYCFKIFQQSPHTLWWSCTHCTGNFTRKNSTKQIFTQPEHFIKN